MAGASAMAVVGRRQRDRGARRRAILDAASAVFSEHGYDAAAMEAIAARANVNIATVYYYYSSKEILYFAVLGRAMGEALDRFERASSRCGDPIEHLVRAAQAYAEFHETHPDVLLLNEYVRRTKRRADGASGDPILAETLAAARRARDLVADALRRGMAAGGLRALAPAETAELLWASLTGVLITCERGRAARASAVARWLDLVLEGLRATPRNEQRS